jgi:hypothetical protein
MPYPFHPSWFDYPKNTWRRVQIMAPLIMRISPLSYYFIFLGPNFLLSNVHRNLFMPILCRRLSSAWCVSWYKRSLRVTGCRYTDRYFIIFLCNGCDRNLLNTWPNVSLVFQVN